MDCRSFSRLLAKSLVGNIPLLRVGLAGKCEEIHLKLSPFLDRLFLIALVVIQGKDQAGLVRASVSRDMMDPSSSVHRAVKWFCKGTSGFRGILFLLPIPGSVSGQAVWGFGTLLYWKMVCVCGGEMTK